jgi:DNA-binding LacI/PurR family transcriptional regulator
MSLNYQLSWRELAHHLVEEFHSTPGTALAGVDALGRQHKVSRLTVKRALNHLEELGIITPAECGKKRQVNLNKLHKVALLQDPGRSRIRLVFLTECPESNPAYMTRSLYEMFHKLCDQEMLFLTYIQVPSDPAELRALLSSIRPRGAILYCVPPAVGETVVALGIPAIDVGGQESRVFPHFFTPYAPLLIRAFEHARAAGHSRITIPMTHKKGPGYEGMAAALEKQFSSAPMTFNRRYNFPLIGGDAVEDYHTALRELFRYTPPTCVIVHGLPDYLIVSSFFLKEGLRIPDDVSVILLSYDPAMVNITPSMAHFVLFSEADSLKAFHVLKEQMSGFRSHEEIKLLSTWTPGDSLAPPK